MPPRVPPRGGGAPMGARTACGVEARTAFGVSRTELLKLFHGRCFTFLGDSITREMHFAMLSEGFACGEAQAPRSSRFTGRRVDQPRMCRMLNKQLRDRSDRVTSIPVDGDPANDIVVRWRWAPRLQALQKALLPPLDANECDYFVINSGLWELQAGSVGAVVQSVGRFVDTLMATPERAAISRARVLWRMTLPVELSRGRANYPSIKRMNAALEPKLRASGLVTFDGASTFLSASGRRTRDGLHPFPRHQARIVMQLLRVVADALAPRAAAPRRMPPSGGRGGHGGGNITRGDRLEATRTRTSTTGRGPTRALIMS